MTAQQERFTHECPKHRNKAQAAIRTGHSPDAATQLLAQPDIQAVTEIAQMDAAERCGLTAEWVLRCLKENVERAMTAAPVTLKDGTVTGEYIYQGQVANRALELIGKCLGMFVDRVDVTSNGESLLPAIILIPSSGASKPDA